MVVPPSLAGNQAALETPPPPRVVALEFAMVRATRGGFRFIAREMRRIKSPGAAIELVKAQRLSTRCHKSRFFTGTISP